MSECPNTGLSNHKLESALTCTVLLQCTPVLNRQTDRQTDRWMNILAIARRFALTNASRAKNVALN